METCLNTFLSLLEICKIECDLDTYKRKENGNCSLQAATENSPFNRYILLSSGKFEMAEKGHNGEYCGKQMNKKPTLTTTKAISNQPFKKLVLLSAKPNYVQKEKNKEYATDDKRNKKEFCESWNDVICLVVLLFLVLGLSEFVKSFFPAPNPA